MTTTPNAFGVDDELGSGGIGLAPDGASGASSTTGAPANLRDFLRAILGSQWYAYANTTALTASKAINRQDGQLTLKLDDYSLWHWEAGATLTDSSHIAPTDVGAGAGRWVAGGGGGGGGGGTVGAVAFKARNVVPRAITIASGLTLATANDGVTNVQGDVVLLWMQATAAQNGPYEVGAPVAGVAPLTRPSWWATGGEFISGQSIDVGGEGTVFKGTSWKAYAASGVIDTNDPQFYPTKVTQQVNLGGGSPTGTVNITNVPIRNAAQSNFLITQVTPTTATLTNGGYEPRSITPSATSPSVAIQACVAGGGINTADGSTLNVTIFQ
jgi:hypothetical protein